MNWTMTIAKSINSTINLTSIKTPSFYLITYKKLCQQAFPKKFGETAPDSQMKAGDYRTMNYGQLNYKNRLGKTPVFYLASV
jgi:hypothetical protein